MQVPARRLRSLRRRLPLDVPVVPVGEGRRRHRRVLLSAVSCVEPPASITFEDAGEAAKKEPDVATVQAGPSGVQRVFYERQVDNKRRENDALRQQLRQKNADLEAERTTRTQVQEENTRLKQKNAKKDKTIVDLTMELFELKRSK